MSMESTRTDLIIKSLDEHKAKHITLFDFRQEHMLFDRFVIADTDNPRHLASLCDYLEDDLKKAVIPFDPSNGVQMGVGPSLI